MAESSWPFDNQDTTEEQYSEIFKRLANTGVIGDPSTSDLKPFGDSSGMQVKLSVGYAFVRGFMYKNDAVKTLTVEAADTNPRIDMAILRLEPATNIVSALIKKGTPAASNAQPPALTQTDAGVFELGLGLVGVDASVSTITAAKVTDARQFTGSQWGRWATSGRPSSPKRGDAGFNLTTAAPEYWNGTTWAPFMDAQIDSSRVLNQQNINAGRISGQKITSSNTGAPSSPAIGDMWVDWS